MTVGSGACEPEEVRNQTNEMTATAPKAQNIGFEDDCLDCERLKSILNELVSVVGGEGSDMRLAVTCGITSLALYQSRDTSSSSSYGTAPYFGISILSGQCYFLRCDMRAK